ncbi:hypothetical protein BHM03_00042105 [Ensete ventricosum]|nr:hypothetical protein BHM03_00042105 [Ensete ventricosum]
MQLVLMRIGFQQQCHGGNNEESCEEEDAPLCCGKELPKCEERPGKSSPKLEERKPCELPLILSSSLLRHG